MYICSDSSGYSIYNKLSLMFVFTNLILMFNSQVWFLEFLHVWLWHNKILRLGTSVEEFTTAQHLPVTSFHLVSALSYCI